MSFFYSKYQKAQQLLFKKRDFVNGLVNSIKEIFTWNKIANDGVIPECNYHLEGSMLYEEVAELMQAIKKKDKVEQLDAICDTYYVLMGTASKLGFTPEQVAEGVYEVNRSNYTKFQKANNEFGYEAFKDNMGKIIKPFTYEKPNLEEIVYGTNKK